LKISPDSLNLVLEELMFVCSKIVAADIGTTFLKNDLSRICIDRLIGGRNMSGRLGEFMFNLPGIFHRDENVPASVAIHYGG